MSGTTEKPRYAAEVHTHNFTKEKTSTVCALCKNMWATTDRITSKYQICSLCGVNIHTSCRSIAQTCIPCMDEPKISYSQGFHLDGYSGWLYIRVLHVFDVNVAPGTPLYAQVRLKHGAQSLRSVTAESGNNDCLWENDPEVPVQHSSLKFHINQGDISSEALKAELQLEVEVWSTFLAFFDTCVATSELTVSPALLFPNTTMERWFTLTNKAGADGTMTEGKLLLSLTFHPAVVMEHPGLSAPVVSSPSNAQSRPHSVPSSSQQGKTEHLPASSSLLPAPSRTPPMSPPEKAIDEPGGRPEKSPAASASPAAPTEVVRRHSGRSSRTASFSEARVESLASVPPEEARRPRTSSSSSRHSEAPSVAETTVSVGGASSRDAATGVAADAAPAADFYQTIAEFTERTTNSIGTFFYEMESLNLAGTASTSNVVDGDWSDDRGNSNAAVTAGKADQIAKPVDVAPALGVGFMHIHIISAFKSKVKDAADGDHYILACVEDSKREFKSKAVFRSATPIFNVRWTIKMEHYRAAVNVFLVDAYTHRRIASARFSCYAMMQRDADQSIPSHKEAPVEKVALRGVSDNEEMGFLTAQVAFEEDMEHLFTSENLHDAPTAPPELLSVQRLGVHIARFTAIIDLFNQWYAEYVYIMEWQEPFTTLAILLAFLFFTLKVKAEYALSGVMFTIVALMTRTMLRRRSGAYVKHYVELGVKGAPKLDYRPVARLRIAVLGFRDGDAKENLTFSKPAMKVTYLPMPESAAPEDTPPEERKVGYFGNTQEGVGFTIPEVSQGVSQLVSNMVSTEVTEKDSILQSVYEPWPVDAHILAAEDKACFIPSETPDLSLMYPIVQPITAKVQAARVATAKMKSGRSESPPAAAQGTEPAADSAKTGSSAAPANATYLPWERNESVVKISFIDEQHSSFGGPSGEFAALALKDIVQNPSLASKNGKRVFEVRKWCRVSKPTSKVLMKTDSRGDLDLFAYDSASSIYMSSSDRDPGNPAADAGIGIRRQLSIVPHGAEVLVRAELEIPPLTALANPSAEDRENSLVLQSLLQGDTGKESSTISVLWNMTDNVKYVQNLMNWLLDQIESVKNIFNWTSPSKTYPIYLAIVALWLVTVVVPGRLLILAVGLYEFFFIFLPIPEGRNTMIRFSNLIQSIPNDDDIAQIYGAEKKAFAASKLAEWTATEKARKMNLALSTRWRGAVSIKASRFGGAGALGGVSEEWVGVYLLLQGHRLVWWISEEALDQGKAAAGQLLLSGHSGITQVSPVDIRKFGGDARLVAVFGQDYVGHPQKLSVLLADAAEKAQLVALLEKKVA